MRAWSRDFGQAGLPHLGERQLKRVLGADERRGEGEVEGDPVRLHSAPGLLGLLDARRAQIDVAPSGEQVLEVPFALAVAQQDEETIAAGMAFTLFGGSTAALQAWARRGANPKTERPVIPRWHCRWALGARTGLQRSKPRPGDCADADRTMDLLDRLDNMDAGEGQSERRPDPLDRRRGRAS